MRACVVSCDARLETAQWLVLGWLVVLLLISSSPTEWGHWEWGVVDPREGRGFFPSVIINNRLPSFTEPGPTSCHTYQSHALNPSKAPHLLSAYCRKYIIPTITRRNEHKSTIRDSNIISAPLS